jgi:hypothetical protein
MSATELAAAIKADFESDNVSEASENIPALLVECVNLFVEDMLKRSGRRSWKDVSAEDLANVVRDIPEYGFLLPLVPNIVEGR